MRLMTWGEFGAWVSQYLGSWWTVAALLYLLAFVLTVAFLSLRFVRSRLSSGSKSRFDDEESYLPEPHSTGASGDGEEIVLTLVHGTWGRRSKWHLKGSSFRKKLAVALHDKGFGAVRFRDFRWSGRNAVHDREQAARWLRRQTGVEAASGNLPREFLIAHSHGGSVALQAMVKEHEAAGSGPSRFAGLACMGTPFLVGTPRGRRSIASLAVALGPIIAVVVILLNPPPLLRRLLEPLVDHAVGGLTALGLLLACLLAALWVGHSVSGSLIPGTGVPSSILRRLFIVRACGDEASAALSVSFIATWAVNKVSALATLPFLEASRGFRALIDQTKRIGTLVALTIFVTVGLYALGLWFTGSFSSEDAWLLGSWGFGLAVAIPLLYLAIGLLIKGLRTAILVCADIVSQFVLGALLLPFGPELLLASPFVLVSAEAVPPIQNGGQSGPVAQLGATTPSGFGMHHFVYEHPETIPQLAAWIVSQFRMPGQFPQNVLHSDILSEPRVADIAS